MVLIIAGLLLIVTILPQLVKAKWAPLELLPEWEVNNPVSKVFVMESIPPTAGSLAAGDSTVPNEYLVDPAIDTLLMLMETQDIYLHQTSAQPSGIIGFDNIVIIKGNFQWKFRNTTSTDRIKGLIWQILQHPDGFTGEIIICDNTQDIGTGINYNDNNSEDPDQSIVDVVNTFAAKGYPVSYSNWANVWGVVVEEYSSGDYNDGFLYDSTSKISYPKFTSPSGNYYISLHYGIWDSISQVYDSDRLRIINFPVLKAHGKAGATVAVKNWIGVLTTAYKDTRYGGYESMHSQYFFGPYALVAKVMGVTYPELTIVDAEWTNPQSNYYGETVHTKMLLGSTDPCAVSWYATKFILTPIAVYPNYTDPDLPGSKYKNNLEAWTNCLADSGFTCTKDSTEISVYDREVLSVTPTFSLKVNVTNGWNMVSVPGVNPDGQGVDFWWQGRDTTANVFKYIDGIGYTPITTTAPIEGYWMKHLGTNEYNTGDEWPVGGIEIVAHNPINATTGWNLIGGYEDTVSTGVITTTPPGLIDGLIYEYSNGYIVAMNLVPGYAYWIKLTGDGVINIPGDPLSKISAEIADYIRDDWGEITITDNAGRSYTLYAVTGQVDLDKYELPPMPPAGMFDIRYGSGRIAEDINSSIQEIQMTGVTYPLTVRAEGMDIRLQDETGKEVNENMRSGKEITISNTQINKLMVIGELIPDENDLGQNYPNPFNPSTTIRFSLPQATQIQLNLYNILGELVEKIAEGNYEAGNYKVTLDASNLPSGVYIYRIESSEYVQVRKMVLLK